MKTPIYHYLKSGIDKEAHSREELIMADEFEKCFGVHGHEVSDPLEI